MGRKRLMKKGRIISSMLVLIMASGFVLSGCGKADAKYFAKVSQYSFWDNQGAESIPQYQYYHIMDQLRREITIVLVSHEMSVISGMANRHLVVDHTVHECTALHHYIPGKCWPESETCDTDHCHCAGDEPDAPGDSPTGKY